MPDLPKELHPENHNPSVPGQGLTKEEAFLRMLHGHWRYLHNQRQNTETSREDRERHAEGQFPFAALLGCADSRVSPEVIFDQAQGDLFVVRVAGHVAGDFEIASLEYAIENLGVTLVIVMGHEKCGAVKAAMQGVDPHGYVGRLISEIVPAIEESRDEPGDALQNAVRANVRCCIRHLPERSECIRNGLAAGQLRLIGLVYDLASGDIVIHETLG